MNAAARVIALTGWLGAAGLVLGGCSTEDVSGVPDPGVSVRVDLQQAGLTLEDDDASSDALSSVSIRPQTSIFDNSGAALDNSDVTVGLRAFNGSSASEALFARGVEFQDETVAAILAQALNAEVMFVDELVRIDLAGFARVTARANDRNVSQFDPPVTLRIKAAGVAPGGPVGWISADEVTGVRRAGDAEVAADGFVTITIDHLADFAVVRGINDEFAGGASGGT